MSRLLRQIWTEVYALTIAVKGGETRQASEDNERRLPLT